MPNSSAQLVQADAGVFMDTSVGYILCKYVMAFMALVVITLLLMKKFVH